MEKHFNAPGIYIDLPESEYFRCDSIGGSTLKNITFNPEEWWWNSDFNKTKPERVEKDGLRFGKALHMAVLEGLQAYEDGYYMAFDASNCPDALDTVADLKNALDARELPKSGNKPDLIDRLLEHDPDIQILQVLKDAYTEENADKETISEAWDTSIRMMVGIAHSDPAISKIVKGGLSEISVFWLEDGVPCRARFDKLRRKGTFDLKSFSMRPGQSIRQGMVRAVMTYRYDLQEAHYRAARKAMQGLPIIGGTDSQRAYLQQCIDEPNPDFKFLFCKSIGAPIFTETSLPPMMIETAEDERRLSLQKWKEYFDTFGIERPWLVESKDTPIEIVDFPAYFGMTG